MAKFDVPHEVAPQTAFVMCGITYVPHYLVKGTYVGPGNVMYPESYLAIFGSERITLPLWPRRYSDL